MKILFCFLLFINIGLLANENWDSFWINGVKACTEKKFEEGINQFSKAIDILERANDETHPQIYIDRGRAFLLTSNFEEALMDFNLALSSKNLSKNDRKRAIISRITAYCRLGKEELTLNEMASLKEIDSDFPQYENTEKHLIIRNVPDCECYQKLVKCSLIHSGICNSKNDIEILPSHIWIIKKRCKCNCECSKQAYFCDICGEYIEFPEDSIVSTTDKCKVWCDKASIAANSGVQTLLNHLDVKQLVIML